MFLLFVIFCSAILIATISGNQCDKLGIALYEDLGCIPQYDPSKPCPSRYNCKDLEPPTLSTSTCIFRGREYADGERLNRSFTNPICSGPCFCRVPSFTCAILDCPEWLGGRPLPVGCYRQYSLDSCCSTGTKCPPFENVAICEFEGKTYQEGDKFYPKDSCMRCVCQKGFEGKLEEPFCRRTICGVQLRRSSNGVRDSCAAVYASKSGDSLCCPDAFLCPDGNEVIQGTAKSEESCRFGIKSLKIGQTFERTNWTDTSLGRKYDKLLCECVVPPLVRCVTV